MPRPVTTVLEIKAINIAKWFFKTARFSDFIFYFG